MMSVPVWLPGPMFPLGGFCPWFHVPFGGKTVSVQGKGLRLGVPVKGVSVQGVSVGRPLPAGIRKAGSTHPTGTLSYYEFQLIRPLWIYFHSLDVAKEMNLFFTACNEVGARLYFHRRLLFCPQGGHAWMGVCMAGGHAWMGGHVWLGGMRGWGYAWMGVHGWGVCMAG